MHGENLKLVFKDVSPVYGTQANTFNIPGSWNY